MKTKLLIQTSLTIFVLLLSKVVHAQDYYEYLKQAQSLYAEENFEKALSAYESAINLKDSVDLVYYNAACCAALSGQKKLAFQYLEKAIEFGYTKINHLKIDTDFKKLHRKRQWKHILAELQKSNDELVNKEVIFNIKPDLDMEYLNNLLTTASEGFTFIAEGSPTARPEESYVSLFEEVLEALKSNSKYHSKFKNIFIVKGREDITPAMQALEAPEEICILVYPIIMKKWTGDRLTFENFSIDVVYKGKKVYQSTAAIKGKVQLIDSTTGRAILKERLTAEIIKILEK
ncbi:MAG: hypothetical protein DWQ02_10195 [Bacteroidetes bacterium]|nr:MAG: hypothetical protein DWQ02_10195 [Bacteroidota bacterium]